MNKIYAKLLVGLLFVLGTMGAYAQTTVSYTAPPTATATNSNGSLVLDMNGGTIDMSIGTTLLVGAGLDATASAVTNIGFDFFLMGTRFTQFTVQEDGILQLGSGTVPTNTYTISGGTLAAPRLAAFCTDSRTGTTTGKIHGKVFGTAPNRVLVVEFVDMQLFYTSTGVAGTSKWQMRFYETNGVIEYMYGTMSVTQTGGSFGSNAPIIGFYTGAAAGSLASITTATHTSNTASLISNPALAVGNVNDLNSGADGSRRFYRYTPPGSAGHATITSLAAPTGPLTFTSITASGMTVNWSAASPLTSILKYAVYYSTDGGTTYTFANTTNVGTNLLAVTGLTPGTTYTWKVVSVSEGALSAATTGTQATTAAATYTWNQTASAAYGTAANWTPTRTTPDVTDILIVDGTGTPTPTITGFTSQTIGQLKLTNSANVTLQASATATLTISGGPGADLDIAAGSRLFSNGASALTITFTSGAGNTANVAGTLEISNTTVVNALTLTNCVMTVPAGGKLAAGGTVTTSPWTGVTATTLLITGTYEHKYTTAAGTIPTAQWNTNSTCLVSGYTSNTAATGGTSQTFFNFIWNCPAQAGNINFTGSVPSANGTFTVTSTGAGVNELRLSGTSAYTVTWANYAQTGGIVDLANGASGTDVINLTTTFNQSAGTFKCTGTATTNVTLNFNGASAQSVTFTGQPAGPIIYRISNTAGITLNANVASFAIGNGTLGGIRITAVVAAPITLGGSVTSLAYNAANSTLTYDASTGIQTTTATEFPATSGPANLTINNTSTAGSLNRVNLHAARTIAGILTMTSGVLVLGNFDLTIGSAGSASGTASNTNFIATNGTGQLIHTYAATGSKTFPVGDITGTDEASAVTINYTALTGASSAVGIKVTDAQHPNDASVSEYLSRYYSFTQSGATTGTFSLTLNYPAGDVVGNVALTKVNRWNGAAWTQVATTVPGATSVVLTGLDYTLLNATADFTLRPAPGAVTYTWIGGISAAYNVSGSWSPARTIVDPTDILQFNGSNIDGASGTGNILATALPATETIAKLILLNNANVNLQASAASSALTIGGATGTDLDVPSGSTLTLSATSTNTAGLAFGGSGNVASIAGTLNLGNGAGTGTITYNCANAVTTVNGTVTAGTSTATAAVSGATTSTLLVNGTWNHAMNGGTIPTATYAVASNLNITGITSTTPSANGIIGGNLLWNCTSQTAVTATFSSNVTAVGGTCTIQSTGTGSFQFGTSPATTVAGLFTVSGGTFNAAGGTLSFNGGSAINSGSITVTGATIVNTTTLNIGAAGSITGGTTALTLNISGNVTNTGTISGSTGGMLLSFNGPSAQTFTQSGTVSTIVNYRVNAGANNLALTGTLPVNNGASLRISGSGTITGGTITYNAGSALTYDNTVAQTTTDSEFPPSGAAGVTINNAGGVILNNSKTISGTLTLTAGVLTLGNNDLTINNVAASSITVTSPGATKMVAITGTGQLKRLIGTSAGTYLYPIGETTGTTQYSGVSLNVTANSANRIIGAIVTDATHPAINIPVVPSDYLSRYWTFSENSAGGTYSFTSTFNYITGAEDVNGTEANIKPAYYTGSGWTQYAGTAGSGSLTTSSAFTEASFTLNGAVITGRTTAPVTYTWTGGISADWTTNGNWNVTGYPNAGDHNVIINTGSGNMPVIATGNNITVNTIDINNAAASLTLNGTASLTTGGAATVTAGSLVLNNTSSLVGGGTFVNAGTVNLNNTSSLSIAGSAFTNSGTFTAAAGSTITLSNGTGYTLPNITYGNLSITGAGTYVQGASMTVNGNYSQSAGIFTVSAGATAFNLNVGGNFTMTNGTFNLLTNTTPTSSTTVTVTGNTTTSGSSSIVLESVSNTNAGGIAIFQTTDFTTTSTSGTIIELGATGTYTGNEFRIRGNLSKSGTGSFNIQSALNFSGGMVFNKPGVQTFNYSGTASGWFSYYINSGSTLQMLSGLVLGVNGNPYSNFTVNGTIDVGTNVISGGSSTVNASNTGFTLSSGATLITQNTTGVTGSITDLTKNFNAAANYEFAGTGAITATNFVTTTMNNLTMSNTAGVTVNGAATVNGTYLLNTGIVNVSTGATVLGASASMTINPTASFKVTTPGSANFADRSVTIKSTTAGTGTIGTCTGAITGASNVTMERWIKLRAGGTGRAYRLLAPTVNTLGHPTKPTMKDNWMEGEMNTTIGVNDNDVPNYGTHITGALGNTNGFDVTTTNQSSVYTASNAADTGAVVYTAVGNTGGALNALTGYFLYIRGDRSVSTTIPLAPGMPTTSTTLRTTGTILQGTQTTFTNSPFLGGAGAVNLVTNPYPSPIDWSLVQPACTGVKTSYTFWDPNFGTRGGFVTVTTGGVASSGLATQFIQPGQAFFVEASGAAAPTVSIQETHKAAGNNNNVFLVPPESFRTELYFTEPNGFRRVADGAIAVYDNAYSAAVDAGDASEINNWDENIALARESKHLAIEGRPVILTRDTLPLFMNNMKQQAYEFEFTPTRFTNTGLKAELIDNFLNTRTLLSVVNAVTVNFTVTANPASSASNRFMVVFGPKTPLAIDVITIRAEAKNNGVQVDWTAKTEMDMDRYELERSFDGTSFSRINTTAAIGSSTVAVNYNWLDANPQTGKNFYRIKAIDKSGQVKYTDVVTVNIGKANPAITVYPNPVNGNSFNLQLTDLEKGVYNLAIFNNLGQMVYRTTVNHAGGSANVPVIPANPLTKGVYELVLTGENTRITNRITKN